MNDRAPIRDRTLVLRILVPRLADRLREKMKELEDAVAAQNSGSSNTNNKTGTPSGKSSSSGGGGNVKEADSIFDLDGVSCEPTPARNKTLWNFHCDGATYPAKLVNLPCPVEVHKTVDHAQYYKCQDIAQMLIVYEDDYALEEAEEKAQEGFPSYYHSGLTPPMKRVVERRFAARERKLVPPPRTAVQDVEEDLMQLMEQLQKDEKGSGNKRNKLPSLQSTTKVLEEVEEVVVTYEPWMDDGGKHPDGVEFDIDDPLTTNHPEIFLTPAEVRDLRDQFLEAQREEERKKQEAAEKKEKKQQKRNKKKEAAAEEKKAAAAAESIKPPVKKKGIASKKSAEEGDEITQAAMLAMGMSAEDLLGDVGDDDLFADLDDLELDGDLGI